jgi:transketolase
MAMAEAFFSARYNRPGHKIIDHFTYVLASDGDLMEGVSAESASLAGHLRLGKLIVLYDNNYITLSAATDLTFTEDVKKRFNAYGWHTQSIQDGNDLVAIERAIKTAQRNKEKPSLILVHTHLGYGSPNKQDTFEAHGSPLGVEEVKLTKQNLGWPLEPTFYIPDAVLAHFREAVEQGRQIETKWDERFSAYTQAYPDLAQELHQVMQGELPQGWDMDIPVFSSDAKGMATRVASGKVMNAIASKLPTFIGGSADLDPSTHTALAGEGDFESPQETMDDPQGSVGGGWRYSGSNLHFGIREHGMGAILNGMAAHGGPLPFGATFLIFSDYMRPPMRLAALMGLHVIYVFTHDSIALGEDGPTHEPVEQLLGLRSIPNMLVIRPADANETAIAWRIAIEHTGGPVALALTRQNLPILDLGKYPHLPLGVHSGGYVLEHATGNAPPDINLIATGSEVQLALAAREKLETQGVRARVVSLPCWNLFDAQPVEYKEAVLPPNVPMLAIEAGVSLGWRSYVGPSIAVIGVDRFGASAPGEVLMREYGFSVEHVVQQVVAVIKRQKKD